MIQCNAVFLDKRDEVVVTCIDITRIKTIETIKKDFVDNVSHELNTPLAAIKGYAETLEDEVAPQHRSYLGIIKRNTDRLISIVQDLLSLSELEDKGLTPHFDAVDVQTLLNNVVKFYEETIRQKGLKLQIQADEQLPVIRGDAFKLEQLLLNLLDNAVKYTEKGTISISISLEEGDIRIDVADTGIGIPEESSGRIFERFYVVDKSRSKKVGGTGLGLSIVKHIVQMHGGSIRVESTAGEGSTFVIRLPSGESGSNQK
jgi:two-component system phosphate regulon sensor histidine kinase PhoR